MQKTPLFCKIVFIVDLVFCILRVPLLLSALLRLLSVQRDITFPFGLGTVTLIILCGVPANVTMLMRRKVGVFFGYAAALFTFGSICIAIWRGIIKVSYYTGSVFWAGTIALAVALFIRSALYACYLAALIIYSRSLQNAPDIDINADGYWVQEDK